jgi:hypothetical protein
MKNILFLESKEYFDDIGIFQDKKYNVKLDGNYFYKNIPVDYDFIVSRLYKNPISNLSILNGKNKRVKTLLFSDGIIEWSNMFNNQSITSYNLKLFHPVIHDLFLCVGKEETKYFNFLGFNTMQFIPKRIKPKRDKLSLPNNKTFLITTANNAYFDNNEKTRLVKLIKSIIQELNTLNYNFSFRVFDDELIKLLEINQFDNIIHNDFEECLQDFSHVITTPSSISLICLYHERALGHLVYRDVPVFIQGGWNLSLSVDILSALENMYSLDKDRMNFQLFQLSNYLINDKDIDSEIMEKLNQCKQESLKQFINQNLLNMLNSRFNINFEYLFRKLYLKFKKNKFFQRIKKSNTIK